MMRDWNELYTRYLHKQCSPEEVRALLEHLREEGSKTELQSRIHTELSSNEIPTTDTQKVTAAFDRIQRRLMGHVLSEAERDPFRVKLLKWLPYAAAAVAIAFVGVWFFNGSLHTDGGYTAVDAADIAPGGNRATLTLADGNVIDLRTEQSGIVIADDRIAYRDGLPVVDGEVINGAQGMDVRNRDSLLLTTPKGGVYQVTLPDGTNVWLNSASTLKYPSKFIGDKRVVELVGEAYFEVAPMYGSSKPSKMKNEREAERKIPFFVKTSSQLVEVLGTQFNISAYEDEADTKTTLVEGSVQIINLTTNAISKLMPGQQSRVFHGKTSVAKVDVISFVAWKEGLFSFNETELHSVMNQLSRWYDISIAYQAGVPVTHYYGAISRTESLASVLELLQQSGLNFKIEKSQSGNQLTVLP